MIRYASSCSCALSLAFAATTAICCDVAAQETAQNPLVESVASPAVAFATVRQSLSPSQIQIYNGVSPDKGDWSSIAITSSNTGVAPTTCTATFLGREVVVTAAHCVITGLARTPSALNAGSLRFECTIDRAYAEGRPGATGIRHFADYALCVADPSAERPVALEMMRWEALDLSAVSAGSQLLAAGFGCVAWMFRPETGELKPGARRLELAVGDFTVDRVEPEHFVSSSDGRTASALCAGDSGGPAFSGVSVKNLASPRVIRGIASQNPTGDGKVASYFTSLSSPRFLRFLECWRGRHPTVQLHISGPVAAPAPRLCQ